MIRPPYARNAPKTTPIIKPSRIDSALISSVTPIPRSRKRQLSSNGPMSISMLALGPAVRSAALPQPKQDQDAGLALLRTRISSASSLGCTSLFTEVSQARNTGSPLAIAIAVFDSISWLFRQSSPGGNTASPLTEACRLGQATLSIEARSARLERISSTGAFAPEPATPRNLSLWNRVGPQVSVGVPMK